MSSNEKTNHNADNNARVRIIEELFATNFIPSYIRKLAHPTDRDYLLDLEQDVYVIVCNMPSDKLSDIYRGDINRLRRYVAGIIHRQLKSTTSAYYRTYKRPTEKLDGNDTYTLAEKEQLNLFTDEWYEEVQNTDFSEKIKI